MCGIVGIMGASQATTVAVTALRRLQHRGHEAAGIISHDGHFHRVRRAGLVGEIFDETVAETLPGSSALGHVRYATSGARHRNAADIAHQAQPLYLATPELSFGLVHNGNITNADTLRTKLQNEGVRFVTDTDTEVIAQLIARLTGPVTKRVAELRFWLEGAYALLVLTPTLCIAATDRYGIRPLVVGRLPDGGYIFASETCALDAVEASFLHHLTAGVVWWSDGQHLERWQSAGGDLHPCVFEYVYFGFPSSLLWGREAYQVRQRAGELLAQEAQALLSDADVIVPVPDSGTPAAVGVSQASGIPLEPGIVRDHHAGRTFIAPAQAVREQANRIKHAIVSSVMKGRHVALVDDSVVRGTASRLVVERICEAGARKVTFLVASPPVRFPCFYGIDTPTQEELLAGECVSDKEAARRLCERSGANAVHFLSLSGLMQAVLSVSGSSERFCDACFTGSYLYKH